MPKVLFLGCNKNQTPYLRAAKNLGFFVIGTDLNPHAPGAAIADRFYPVGYTDIEELIKVARTENFGPDDRVFTAAAHFAHAAAASISEQMGIDYPSAQNVDICLDKIKFHALLLEHGIDVPPSQRIDPGKCLEVEQGKIYYLKSDYGKSPKYCYRITNGELPTLPEKYDSFYRAAFVLQDEIVGVHLRVNLYPGNTAVFLKIDDRCAFPIKNLGPGHAATVDRLRQVPDSLGLKDFIVKFDLIATSERWYVIDIGIDPPMRLRLLSEYMGIDFTTAYTKLYLTGEAEDLPRWDAICQPVLIESDPGSAARFIILGGQR